ncbi:AMP-binding protein [Aggregicoccus sp. 17bor-14]|uniref:AMP-binding protein n=1 Tax=Myxococcaceae TaxID=31 RepID=UPI00129CAC71|nr:MULTISPECIES: AMP-binding protein [Myxococcaceae]MBF5042719.1 AMP-binding protein [Simulacricoccus sp. 17bor-14]MRI88487.1 AMP-binding protein [Aggregicoccus sp. 17bor-14]
MSPPSPPSPPGASLAERLARVPSLHLQDAQGRPVRDPREQARALARSLREAGLEPGDRLAVQLPNGPAFVTALLACAEGGLTFVPLPLALEGAALQGRLQAAGAAALLGERGLQVSPQSPVTPMQGEPPAVILFTSGSEGVGRPVALGGRALLHVVDTHRPLLGVDASTRITGYLSWSHAFGFTLELLLGLLAGAQLRSVPAADFPAALTEAPADFLLTVPRMLERLEVGALRSLQGGIVGGAPVRGALRERLVGSRLRVGYGQTECAPGATLGEPGEWELDDFLGRPVGCELRLDAPGELGLRELLLRGDNLALGYLVDGALQPMVRPDGWRALGDLGRAAHGGYVFEGRRDELFKLDNGRMVNPAPLEAPFGGRILLVGAGRERVQPLARGEEPARFELPVPHLPPRLMPEAFWNACTTPSGKVSRRRAQQLFEQMTEQSFEES